MRRREKGRKSKNGNDVHGYAKNNQTNKKRDTNSY